MPARCTTAASGTFSVAHERFFLVGDGAGDPDAPAPIWIATMQGAPLPSPTYNHAAFKIEETDYERCLAAIQSLGLEVREGRARVDGEGCSIYFHDYDNHLFELHTGTLSERLARYARER
jgi:hypothetical protein